MLAKSLSRNLQVVGVVGVGVGGKGICIDLPPGSLWLHSGCILSYKYFSAPDCSVSVVISIQWKPRLYLLFSLIQVFDSSGPR